MNRCTATTLALLVLFLLAAPSRAQQPGDIVITEVLVNPGGTITDAYGEWFELHNNTNHPINLQNWFVQDSAASGLRPMHKITASLVIAEHGFVVLGNSTNTTDNGGVTVDYAYTRTDEFGGTSTSLALANSLDAIRIIAPDSVTVIDRVKYAAAAISAQNGISRELKDVTLDNHNMDGANWVAAEVFTVYGPGGRGTPGVAGQTTGMLPVELVAFTATLDGTSAHLAWSTASETNNAGFDVEHRSGADSFRAVGFVPGHGTKLETSSYAQTVTGLAPGTHLFRLRQVDFDGAFEYSPEVELTLEADGLALALVGLPASEALRGTLIVPNAGSARVTLYDVLGRKQAEQDVPAGAFTFDVSTFAAGSYVLRVESGSQAITRSVSVLR